MTARILFFFEKILSVISMAISCFYLMFYSFYKWISLTSRMLQYWELLISFTALDYRSNLYEVVLFSIINWVFSKTDFSFKFCLNYWKLSLAFLNRIWYFRWFWFFDVKIYCNPTTWTGCERASNVYFIFFHLLLYF